MASVREWDEDSSYRSERHSRPVTVRRYKISDPDDQADDRWETSSRHSRREPESRARSRSRETTREIRIERKQVSRSPSPEVREWRIKREVSRDPPHRDDYDLDHYTRSTEYFERERPEHHRHHEPQTIIIKNEAPTPIIIRERESVQGRELTVRDSPPPEPVEEKKEDKLEVQVSQSHRSASVDDRQTVRRDTSPDEDYYYQRTTREIARRPAPRDDYDDYNRTRRRGPDNDTYSDDDVYYRRTEYVDPDEHTIHDPNHRRHLLEGAVVGLGAAALLNRDKKKKGEKSGGTGTLLGGAAVGAAGTEIYSRARQHWGRSRSRSREREYSSRGRQWDDDAGPRERSSSRGLPGGSLAKLGAVAVVGALAGYAASRAGGKNKKDGRRSRSRRRRQSRGASHSRSSSIDGAPSASKRNSTIAGAGLASAAVAGLVEHHRNKSRPGRSKSRLRTGLPVAAAGLGGAALAGLYENNKAKRAKAEARARSLSGSSSRARSRSVGASEHARDTANERRLIEYGDDPISPEHDRPRSRADSYYSDYGRRRGSPSSAESSPRRRRSHSRGVEDAAAGAGVAGIAAHEASKRRERKRAERERWRREEERNDTPQQAQGYDFGPYAQEPPPPPPMGTVPPAMQYGNQFYPQTNNFAPPPANAYSPAPNFGGQGPYNTPEFAQPQPQYVPQPRAANSDPYAYSAAPAPAEHYDANDARLQQPGPHVSYTFPATSTANDTAEMDVETAQQHMTGPLPPTAISPTAAMPTSPPHVGVERRLSRVRFNLEPDAGKLSERSSIRDASIHSETEIEHRQSRARNTATGDPSTSHQSRRRHPPRRTSSPVSDNSDDTVELPDRFDEHGHRKRERGEDLLADALEDAFNGRGTAGSLLHRFAGSLVGVARFRGRRRSQ